MATQFMQTDYLKKGLAGLALLLISVNVAGCARSPISTTPESSPAATTPTPQAYRPPPTWENMSPEMQRIYQAEEATRIAILTTVPQVTLGPDWTPPVVMVSTAVELTPNSAVRVAGAGRIVEDSQTGFSSEAGLFRNQWQREADSPQGRVYTHVYAGVEKRDPLQGLLLMEVITQSQSTSFGSYRTPLRVGPIRVIDAVGEQLTLRADDGTLFTFDVPTRQWVTPAPSPVPSTLPTP